MTERESTINDTVIINHTSVLLQYQPRLSLKQSST
jgi:hypothetical protein